MGHCAIDTRISMVAQIPMLQLLALILLSGDYSYEVLRCASRTRQMFRAAVTVMSVCMGAHKYARLNKSSTLSATLLWVHCNWKIVSRVDDELGMAVVVCINTYASNISIQFQVCA